jgi:DNA-binding MarR family transcriptional regulator
MKQSFEDNLYWLLLKVSIRAKQGWMQLAEKHDLSVMQLFVLSSLEPGKSVPMRWAASLLVCDASNVTGIIDRLLTLGYVLREESPTDRRVKMLTLTAKGEQLRNTILDYMPQFHPVGLEKIDDEKKQQLFELLSLMLKTDDIK